MIIQQVVDAITADAAELDRASRQLARLEDKISATSQSKESVTDLVASGGSSKKSSKVDIEQEETLQELRERRANERGVLLLKSGGVVKKRNAKPLVEGAHEGALEDHDQDEDKLHLDAAALRNARYVEGFHRMEDDGYTSGSVSPSGRARKSHKSKSYKNKQDKVEQGGQGQGAEARATSIQA